MRRLSAVFLALSLAATVGCPGGLPKAPNKPGMPGSSAGSVNPDSCGGYASTDIGKKIKAFLQATVTLDKAASDLENYLVDTCKMMGSELGIPADQLEGTDTRTICSAVATELDSSIAASVKAKADLKVDYKPAVCKVDVNVAASAAAQCEGKASGSVSATCTGYCDGTCNGQCDGTCAADGSGGQCAGACDGTCSGECSGSCDGAAEVDAEASCRAHAMVKANAEVKCEPAEVDVTWDAGIVVDTAKLEKAAAAIKVGLPRLLLVHRKGTGPLLIAVKAWAKATHELVDAGRSLLSDVGDQALCVSGQLAAALDMIAGIEARMSVSVEVSVEVSGSAGASI